jgi:hypothetical protein
MSIPKKADALIENAQFYRFKSGDARRFYVQSSAVLPVAT